MRRWILGFGLAFVVACSPAGEPPEESGPIEVSSGDLTYCDAIEAPATKSDCRLAEIAADQTQAGLAELRFPARMVKDRPSTVRLLVTRTVAPPPPEPSEAPAAETDETPEVAVDPASGGEESAGPEDAPAAAPEVSVTYQPLVGRVTSARVETADFEVSPAEAVTKEIPRRGQAVWIWQLTPLRDGLLKFTVVTNVQFRRSDGTVANLAQQVTEYEVTAGVGWTGVLRAWLENAPDWIKLVAGVLTALAVLAGAAWALWRAIKGGAPPKA